MLKHSRSDKSVVGTNRDTNELQEIRGMSNTELLDGIDRMLDCEDELPDAEKLEQYLKALQEKAPVMEGYDAEAQWDKLMADHPELSEDEPKAEQMTSKVAKRKRPWLRVGLVAALAVVFLGVSADAWKINPFSSFIDWAQGIMQIHSEPSGIMELPDNDPSEYHSLAEALTKNGIDASGCPTWIPEDYSFEYATVRKEEEVLRISSIYASNRGEIIFRITKFDENWNNSEERNDTADLFEFNGREYWIISNLEIEKANWKDEDLVYYAVSGQISNDEIKRIIMSIQRSE